MGKYTYFEKVYDIVREIPSGRVTTYGAIHRALGEGSARSVGWALNQLKHNTLDVPAHRVVNKSGLLTGSRYFENGNEMETRLQAEGLVIENGKISEFSKYFWDPSIELLRGL